MNRHLDVLALLYVVWGALFLLAGLIGLALTVGAAALAGRAAGDVGVELAAGLTAATFGMVAVTALAWGGIHALAGVAVRRQRPWGRAVAVVFGVLDLALLPLGTALGLYALWVLLHDEVRSRFRSVGA